MAISNGEIWQKRNKAINAGMAISAVMAKSKWRKNKAKAISENEKQINSVKSVEKNQQRNGVSAKSGNGAASKGSVSSMAKKNQRHQQHL